MEFTRRVYEDGKVTIPKELRDLHDIAEGDFVRLEIVEVVRRPEPPRMPEARLPEPRQPEPVRLPPTADTPRSRRRKRA